MKYKVYGNYVFSKFLGEVEASSQEEAIEKACRKVKTIAINRGLRLPINEKTFCISSQDR